MNREDMCEEMFHVVGGYVAGIPSGWEIEARHNMEEE
jgi:hypothetical protein